MQLYQWLDQWIEVYKEGNVRENTYSNYEYAIRLVKCNVPNREIEKLSEMDIQILLQKLFKKGYSKSTIRLVKLTLTQAFRKAVKMHYIPDNIAEDTKIPRMAAEKTVDALSFEDQKKVIEAARNDLHGDLLIFLLQTGLRKSEMMNLEWEDFYPYTIDGIEHWFIQVKNSKTRNGVREIPLTEEAIQIIDSQPIINGYIFNSKNGTPITKTVLRRLCERITKQTGVHLTPHICRHTFATRLYEHNADMKTLSALIGHSQVSFTIQRYVTANPQKKVETISLLSE